MVYIFNIWTTITLFFMKPYRQLHLWLLRYADNQLDYIFTLTERYRKTYAFQYDTTTLDMTKIESLCQEAIQISELNLSMESAADIRHFFMNVIAIKMRYASIMIEMEERNAWHALFEETFGVS